MSSNGANELLKIHVQFPRSFRHKNDLNSFKSPCFVFSSFSYLSFFSACFLFHRILHRSTTVIFSKLLGIENSPEGGFEKTSRTVWKAKFCQWRLNYSRFTCEKNMIRGSLIGRIDFLTREKKRYVPFDWLSASSTSFQMKIYFAPIQSVKSQYVHNKIRYL